MGPQEKQAHRPQSGRPSLNRFGKQILRSALLPLVAGAMMMASCSDNKPIPDELKTTGVRGRADSAQEHHRDSVRREQASKQFAMGKSWQEKGYCEQALEQYIQAAQGAEGLKPQIAAELVRMSQVFSRAGEWAKSKEVLERAESYGAEPGGLAWAHLELGASYLKEGRAQEANAHFGRAVSLNPNVADSVTAIVGRSKARTPQPARSPEVQRLLEWIRVGELQDGQPVLITTSGPQGAQWVEMQKRKWLKAKKLETLPQMSTQIIGTYHGFDEVRQTIKFEGYPNIPKLALQTREYWSDNLTAAEIVDLKKLAVGQRVQVFYLDRDGRNSIETHTGQLKGFRREGGYDYLDFMDGRWIYLDDVVFTKRLE